MVVLGVNEWKKEEGRSNYTSKKKSDPIDLLLGGEEERKKERS
jgi:hypothetical protein